LKYIGYGGAGKQVRDILHIDDLVDLIDLQIHQPELFDGKVFNAGGGLGSSASLREMTTLCEKITGNRIDIAQEPVTRQADLRIYITDNSNITKATGWQPKRSIDSILKDIFDWIKADESRLQNILK
jgi:CDP-paratose 2-epimerase